MKDGVRRYPQRRGRSNRRSSYSASRCPRRRLPPICRRPAKTRKIDSESDGTSETTPRKARVPPRGYRREPPLDRPGTDRRRHRGIGERVHAADRAERQVGRRPSAVLGSITVRAGVLRVMALIGFWLCALPFRPRLTLLLQNTPHTSFAPCRGAVREVFSARSLLHCRPTQETETPDLKNQVRR